MQNCLHIPMENTLRLGKSWVHSASASEKEKTENEGFEIESCTMRRRMI